MNKLQEVEAQLRKAIGMPTWETCRMVARNALYLLQVAMKGAASAPTPSVPTAPAQACTCGSGLGHARHCPLFDESMMRYKPWGGCRDIGPYGWLINPKHWIRRE